MAKTIFVVGIRYADFLKMDQVISLEEFEGVLAGDPVHISPETVFAFRQGISEEKRIEITRKVKNGLYNKIELFPDYTKASRKATHKAFHKNIMISEPECVEKNTYLSYLSLDSPAELDDHITGLHITGMALNEAARQMFIGVTELHFMEDDGKKSYFVINEFNTSYSNFVFPIPALIRYDILEQTGNGTTRKTYRARIRFYQCDRRCATETNVTFSVFDAEHLSRKERDLALLALGSDPANFRSVVQADPSRKIA